MTLKMPPYRIHLPDIRGAPDPGAGGHGGTDNPCAMPPLAYALYERIRTAPEQGRSQMRCHPVLVQAARLRVETILRENHFSHTTLAGVTVNEFLRGPDVGYKLPDWYPAKGNNCESLGGNTYNEDDPPRSVDDQFNGWLQSPAHRAHMLGENFFYADQTEVGLWFEHQDGVADVDAVWCFLSAHPEG